MPIWNAVDYVETLNRGVAKTVFAETLSDGNESQAMALPASRGTQGVDLVWEVMFASAPSTVDYRLQSSLTNVDANFHDTGPTMTSNDGGAVTVGDIVANFVRIKAVDADSPSVTAKILIK
tara:strand:- start:166 stop:528 length:363 start_codon:yes stop_codon:yes gene_type:complete